MDKEPAILLMVLSMFGMLFYQTQTDQYSEIVPYSVSQAFLLSNTVKEFIMTYKGTQQYYNLPTSPIPHQIRLKVIENSDSEVTFIITDGNSFHVPEDNSFFPSDKTTDDTGKRMYQYSVLPDKDTLFKLERVLDDGTTEPVFDTTGKEFIYSALYSTIGTNLNNDYLYGFGERRKSFRYSQSGNYTTLPKDQFIQIDTGKPNEQTYGYHPMWLKREESGNFHVGFLKSTSPLRTDIQAGKSFQLHIIGGQIYLKFFFGDNNPEKVIKAYHNYINGYTLQPFWTHGFHFSRWGFNSSKDMLDLRQKFQDNGFPIDVIWNDLDYMVDYQDFTLQDKYKVSEMSELTDVTKDLGVYWVPLIDIGVAVNTDSAKDGVEKGIFLKSSVYDGPLLACVWPGEVYFPDFNHPGSFNYWDQSLKTMYDPLGLKPWGYWIDMNENSNFIPGEKNKTEPCPPANPVTTPETKKEIDDSHYVPFSVSGDQVLAHKAVTMSTVHYNGSDAILIPNQNTTELFFHPLNSYGEAYISSESLKKTTNSKLAFLLSRASIYGTGRFAAHWTGDNLASWDFYQYAVAELLPFQLFGIPLVGNDLCGFAGNTNAELCTRWMQFGAWMPFSRNHNNNESIAQDPFAFNDTYVLPATKSAFLQRYSHLKWLYSLYVRNWDKFNGFASGTVMKPIWWNFPEDLEAYNHEDTQFMLGEEIMVAPILTKGNPTKKTTLVSVYFPGTSDDVWVYPKNNGALYKGGVTNVFEIAFDQDIPYFLRSGYIVARQEPKLRSRLLDNRFYLNAALKQLQKESTKYYAVGYMMSLNSYDDNNVHDSCMSDVSDCLVQVRIEGEVLNKQFKGSLSIYPQSHTTVVQEFYIDSIKIYGLGGVQEFVFPSKDLRPPVLVNVVFNI